MLEQALQYHSYGLQVLPAANKFPRGATWKKYQSQFMTPLELRDYFAAEINKQPIEQICLVAGKVSGGLEIIDIDSKYDNTGKLFESLKKYIDDNLPDVVDSLVIDQTPSGGYHIYYRCEVIAGNQKLARRPTTEEERSKKPDEKILVLIETRGEGGIIIVPPTKGYSIIQGSFASLPTLSPEQRSCLLGICRSFNEEPDPQPRPTYQASAGGAMREGLSPFADYNQKDDVFDLLYRHGWKYVDTQGPRINFKRPGESDTRTSGNFHTGFRKFFFFSSSTEFEPEKPYSPADVFILLECKGDKSEASRRLLASGYGTPSGNKQRVTRNQTPNSRVDYINAEGAFEELSTENVLTEEKAKSVVTDGLYIYFTKDTPKPEIFQSLALLEQASSAAIYLVEVADLANTKEPLITYRPSGFKAQDIISRYAEVYELNDQSISPEIEDGFIKEFISTGQTITDPFEKDRFRDLFLRFSQENDLSITPESIKAVEDQLTYNRQREEQNQSLTDLIEKAGKLQQKGDLSGSLKLLLKDSKNLSALGKADTFASLSKPITESELMSRFRDKPIPLESGFSFTDSKGNPDPIVIPSGQITILAGATSHGKTILLTNLALSLCELYPDKHFHLFSYEQDEETYLVNALNAYIGDGALAYNNRESIEHFFRGQTNIIRTDRLAKTERSYPLWYPGKISLFEEKRKTFFFDLIATGRLNIHYVDYDSDTLIDAIKYLLKTEPLGAVLTDYVQLINLPSERNKGLARQEEIKRMCQDFNQLANDTGIPLIFGAQFNREVTNLAQMHATKLGEAGDLERIANLIIGLWNNQFSGLNPSKEDKSKIDKRVGDSPDPNTWYVEALKRRGGQVGAWDIWNYDAKAGKVTNNRTL